MAEYYVTLPLTSELASEYKNLQQDFLLELLERGLREMKIDRALKLYAEGGLSFGAAAERAGVSQPDLARHAYARGLEPPFSATTLSEELGKV